MAEADASVVQIEARPEVGLDLLRFGPIRHLVLWGGFPYVFQAAMLLVLLALAMLGWGYLTPRGVPDKLYAKCNLVTLVIWGLFWPAIVWLTVVFGRVWCTVCPLELASNLAERTGRALGTCRRRFGRWLRAGWLMVVAYALIQFLVAGVHLHRVPAYTSIFLFALLLLAVASGLFVQDRAFCRALCPVAPLLRVYGRGGLLAVRPGPAVKCQACEDKHCTNPANRTRLDARSCPSLLNPGKLDSSEECLMCTQCIKVCAPGNMRLLLRPPYSRWDARTPAAPWAITVFVMLLSGFVTSEVTSEWAAAQRVLQTPVHWLSHQWRLGAATGWIEGVWVLVVFPLLLWTLLGSLAVLFRSAGGLTEAWRRMALPMGIVIAAGHMSKGLAKFTSWAGFLPGALQDPNGVATAMAMTAQAVPQPAPIFSLAVVAVIGVSLTVAALCFTLRECRIVDGRLRLGRVLPDGLMAGAYSFVIFGWGFLQ